MLASSGMLVGSLASCAAGLQVYKTRIVDKKISVPVEQFANTNFRLIQPANLYYNIGLKKETDGRYTALLLRCTHADNQLIQAGNGFKCTLHGSAFDQEGRVITGPADRPLKRYSTQVVSGQVIIQVTD